MCNNSSISSLVSDTSGLASVSDCSSSPQKLCVDCGRPIIPQATRCHGCAVRAVRAVRAAKKAGVYKPRSQSYCLDCGKPIHVTSNRCQSCAGRFAHANGAFGEGWRRKNAEGHRRAHAEGKYKNAKNPEVIQRTSATLRAMHANRQIVTPASGHPGSEALRRKVSESAKRRCTPEWRTHVVEELKQAHARGAYDYCPKKPSKLEMSISQALRDLGIVHDTQYRPHSSTYDFDVFIAPNILIEINGTYWHADPRVYDCPPARVAKIWDRDTQKQEWARNNGYRLYVFWENDIKALTPVGIVQQMLSEFDLEHICTA